MIPGFFASDRTCSELRLSLAEAGWRTFPWDLGLNRGAQIDTLRHIRQRLEVIHDGRPILLVGWSLGGVYAREIARQVPELVRAVVTLGSPFSGDPHMNNVWRLYEWVAGHPVDNPPVPHYPDKPPVPTLAIWSRKDGIIAPRAARGLDGERDAGGRDRLQPHGIRRVGEGDAAGGAGNRQVPESPRLIFRRLLFR